MIIKQYPLKLTIILGMVIFVCACKKNWLDTKPLQSLSVPATLQDFQALLDNTSLMNLSSPALQELSADNHYLTDDYINSSLKGDYALNAYTWSHSVPYIGNQDWVQPYTRIFNCNVAIEGIGTYKSASNNEQQILNNILGQALFQRSRNFYELAQIFAPPYKSSTAETDLSINLRLSSDINIKTSRSTVKLTYGQIVSDLLIAKDLLPLASVYKTRPCKPAAMALLARIYVSMGDYNNAGKYADSCLKIYNTLLDYNTVSNTDAYPFPRFNDEVIFHNSLSNYGFVRNLLIDSSFYETYSANDLRQSLFFRINSDGSISFRGNYTKNVLLFGGLTTDEIYLIRAECYARAGNVNDALGDLNTLLFNRWKSGTFIPYTALSPDDALSKILSERKKELICRGLRWTDLRRLNMEPNYATTITRTALGGTYVLKVNSYQYTFPIPDDIIQISEIQQNIGW